MGERNIFQLLADIAKKTGIPFVLIGGFALSHYKYARQTADVDFLIKKQDFPKVLDLLEAAGYQMDYSQEVFARLISTTGPLLMDIDFMFIDQETMAKIINDSQKVRIAGQEFRVPSLEHLIALKLHAVKYNPQPRLMKDIPDIINLVKINKMDVKNKHFKELCLKYATPEIYQKILDSI